MVVELGLGGGGGAAVAIAANTDETEAASEPFVSSKPSGYPKIKFPGSPGSTNGGWTGLSVKFPVPQLPTQNEAT